MASGERAADRTKGFFSQFSHAAEDLRKNVNSYADGVTSGTHANSADTNGEHETGTFRTGSKHDFNPDAQKAGDMLKTGARDTEKKLHEMRANHAARHGK